MKITLHYKFFNIFFLADLHYIVKLTSDPLEIIVKFD